MKGLVETLLIGSLFSMTGIKAAVSAARPAGSPPVLRFQIVHTDKWFRSHHIHALLPYPVITGMRDLQVEREVNRNLRDACPPGGMAGYLRSEMARPNPNEVIHMDGYSSVKLLRGHFMSVYYEETDFPTRNGEFIRDSNINRSYSSITVDLRTGRVVHLSDLFHSLGWRDKLDSLIVREVRRTVDWMDESSVRESVEKHLYDFYLTGDKIYIYNIFNQHAGAGFEVAISRQAVWGL
ncbi:MAG: hypothetical protein M3Y56_00585 [Armatimonadota bacterium]|nr:hypothetical protein [Armatimonadota bacterium]